MTANQPPQGQSPGNPSQQAQSPQGRPPGGGDVPRGFDWVTLEDGEEIEWTGKPHFYSIVPALVIGLPLSLLLVGIPIVVGAYLNRENTDYVITTKGLYRKRGVLSRDVQQIEFDKVQNISFNQGPLGNYVGYGSVDISTAGGSGVEMQFRSVPDPKTVQERINRHIRRSRDAPESEADSKADVLDQILAELQAIRAAVEDGQGHTHPAGADDPDHGDQPTGDQREQPTERHDDRPTGGHDEHESS